MVQSNPYSPRTKLFSKDLYSAVNIMHDKCELIALAGAGKNPEHPTNHLYLWDVHKKKLNDLVCDSTVLNIELRFSRFLYYKLFNINTSGLISYFA